ncbi:MAG: hypothetical protein AB1634_07085 [Thermodesulfobacteriota bacterium]
MVVVYSRSRLDEVLKGRRPGPSPWRCLLGDAAPRSWHAWLRDRGIEPWTPPQTSRARQEEILRETLHLVGSLAEENGHDLQWWATDLAAKNRFLSPLPGLITALVHYLDAAEAAAADGGQILLVCPPWPILGVVAADANNRGWGFSLAAPWWLGRWQRWSGRCRAWFEVLRSWTISVVRLVECRWYYGTMPAAVQERPTYLIKSFVYPSSLVPGEEPRDPFMGRLATFLAGRFGGQAQVLTVAVTLGARPHCYRRMRTLPDHRLVPLEAALSWSDLPCELARLVWGRCRRPFRVGKKVFLQGRDITSLLDECLASGGWRIVFYNWLHLAAARRLAAAYALVGCAMTSEGNAWERMFVAGLRQVRPRLPVYGYQHSVIPLAAAGMFQDRRELATAMPLPDRIMTTGTVPAALLAKYGAVSPERIAVAGALRYQYLAAMQPSPRLAAGRGRFRILAALEGVWEVVPLVRYVLRQAIACPHLEFQLRAHPVLPLANILRMLDQGGPLPANVSASSGSTVQEDVESADAVLYWGTTIALEALMIGRPVVHFDKGDVISYDPLFALDAFKWTVSSASSLADIVRDIEALAPADYHQRRQAARAYVASYLSAAEDQLLLGFVPGPLRDAQAAAADRKKDDFVDPGAR